MSPIGGEGFSKSFINGYDHSTDNSANIFEDTKVVLFCRETNLSIKAPSPTNAFIDLLNKMYKADDPDITLFFFFNSYKLYKNSLLCIHVHSIVNSYMYQNQSLYYELIAIVSIDVTCCQFTS